jgi:2-hydroxychromene-2-carboxylate isomerase
VTTISRSFADVMSRRVLPRAVVALSRVDAPARLAARLRRRLGRPARAELYFAFDDPSSAVAVLDLAERLAGMDVRLLLRPVVRRGIAGDPAVELKRRYAVQDARRLARRSGRVLGRDAPVPADDVAFLAAWVAADDGAGPAVTGFCVAALSRLWLAPEAPIDREDYAALWREAFGAEPPGAATAADGADPVRRNERRMARRGPYDTPAAWVHGQWSFAHDRPAQIAARLEGLGWGSAA